MLVGRRGTTFNLALKQRFKANRVPAHGSTCKSTGPNRDRAAGSPPLPARLCFCKNFSPGYHSSNVPRYSGAASRLVLISNITPPGARQKKREPRPLLNTPVSISTPSPLNRSYNC